MMIRAVIKRERIPVFQKSRTQIDQRDGAQVFLCGLEDFVIMIGLMYSRKLFFQNRSGRGNQQKFGGKTGILRKLAEPRHIGCNGFLAVRDGCADEIPVFSLVNSGISASAGIQLIICVETDKKFAAGEMIGEIPLNAAAQRTIRQG